MKIFITAFLFISLFFLTSCQKDLLDSSSSSCVGVECDSSYYDEGTHDNTFIAEAIGWTSGVVGFELGLIFRGSSSVSAHGYLYVDSLCDYPSGEYKVTTVSKGNYNSLTDTITNLSLKAAGGKSIHLEIDSAGLVGSQPGLKGAKGVYETGLWAFVNTECGRYLLGYGSSVSNTKAQRGLASLESYRWFSLALILFMVFFAGLSWFVWSYKADKNK